MGLCGLVSCNANKFTFGSNVTPIRQLQQRTDNQRKVYVQGKVEKHAPLIKKWVYQINDSTSKIWVVTDESNYKEGQEIVFKAKVHYKSIPLAGQEFGEVYLEEE